MTNSSEKRAAPLSKTASWWRRVSRKQVLIALGILLGFNLLFYVAAVAPLDAREAKHQALISSLARQVQEKTREVDKLRLVVEKVESARGEGDDLLNEVMLVRDTTYSTLVEEFVQAAQQTGIETREGSFEMEPVEGAAQYGVVTITANFRGPYENLVKFLNRLDRSKHFLIIASLGATPRSESNELQVAMRIDTFVRGL